MIGKHISLCLSLVAILVLLLLAGCDLNQSDNRIPAESATSDALFTLVHLPTPGLRTVSAMSLTQGSTPAPENPSLVGCEFGYEGPRTRYQLDAILDWDTRRVRVEQTVRYRNDTLETLEEMMFVVAPRRFASVNIMSFQHALTEDGESIRDVTLDGWRLAVPLPKAIEPGCDAVVRLLFTLQLEPYSGTNPEGWLAYTNRQLNLGHWFPTVGLYGYETPDEWFVPERHIIGEQTASEIADYTVRLEVDHAPQGLQIAAPGDMTQPEDNIWEFRLAGARDFAMSLSTEFQKTTQVVEDVQLELYYFPSTNSKEGVASASLRAMADARQALALYIELFGSYPYERMVVVEGDFPDGLEFTGMVFVGEAWFRTWNGKPDDWLTIITVHEMAHQWWYALIGNNQAATPYLDEALATYTELLYYERYYPNLVEWWWSFRIFLYTSESPVDGTVYEYSSWRPYINAVYLRGVIMLQRVRDEIGDEMFMKWLRDYAANNAGKVATSADFWGSLPPQAYLMTTSIRQEFLRGADILPIAASQPPTATIVPETGE